VNGLGELFGQDQKLGLIGVQGFGKSADQRLAGIIAEVQLAVLDLGNISESHSYLSRQAAQGVTLGFSEFPHPESEGYRAVPACVPHSCIVG